MPEIEIDTELKTRVLKGRKTVEEYREAHGKLYENDWYKGISGDHTPLLKKQIKALEKIGYISSENEFEPKKNKILAKFWDESDLLNIQELDFKDKEDFREKAKKEDREALEDKWK